MIREVKRLAQSVAQIQILWVLYRPSVFLYVLLHSSTIFTVYHGPGTALGDNTVLKTKPCPHRACLFSSGEKTGKQVRHGYVLSKNNKAE